MKSKLLFSRPQEMNDILGHSSHEKVKCSKCAQDSSSWVLQFLYLSDNKTGMYECMICQEKVEVVMNEDILEVVENNNEYEIEPGTEFCCGVMKENECEVLNEVEPTIEYCPWCGVPVSYT